MSRKRSHRITGEAAVAPAAPRTGSPSPAGRKFAEVVAPGERFRTPARLVGAQARIRSRWPVFALCGLSLLLSCLIFPPVGWWWLAYGCLVPWLVCVCTVQRSRLVYFISYLFGLAFFLINVGWLYQVTPPGYFALCLYYAVFFPLAAWPIRHMYARHGVSAALTTPIVWVAAEYLRSIGALGFPWLLLGHSQYEVLTMIQISDLVGAYGVSFVVAMINGWITDLLIQPILIWRTDNATRLPIGSLTTLLVVLGTVIYGSTQRSQRFLEPGPKVAIIQHDFPMFVDDRAGSTSAELVFEAYLELTRQAAAQKPDLIVLPETVVQGYINDEFLSASPTDLDEIRRHRYPPAYDLRYMTYLQKFSRRIRDAFQRVADESGVPIVLGSSSMQWKPTAIPPRVDAYNSAYLLKPGESKPAARYDKIHLVLFGEYVPFRFSYGDLYDWLNSITPWGRMGIEYSLSPGEDFAVFEFDAASQNRRRYRVAAPICYEEIMPYIARTFVRGPTGPGDKKNIDLLLSISNDGWFLHTAELEQHLAAAVFRAVEHRIPVARSVNTGASAILHPNGKIHLRVELPQEKLALLDHVEAGLRSIDAVAEKMESLISSPEAYRESLAELARLRSQDLTRALGAMGNEYKYINARLGACSTGLMGASEQARLDALGDFREQVRYDLETVARWRDRPDTAPGFAVAQLRQDSRPTLYTRWGDWFALATVVLAAMMLADWFLRRIRRLSATDKAQESEKA